MNQSIRAAILVLSLLPAIVLAAESRCELDLLWFRYSALDAITLREGDDAKVAKLLQAPDEPAMIQLGLWYVYRHASSARVLFAKADLEKLFKDGAIPRDRSSILFTNSGGRALTRCRAPR